MSLALAIPLGGALSLTDRRINEPTKGTQRSATLSGRPTNFQELRFRAPSGDLVVQFAGKEPCWLRETATSLVKLLFLGSDWDSFGAFPIDPACVVAAMQTASAVMRSDSPLPSIVPTVRGGVQLEWHMRGIDLEVEVVTPSRLVGVFEDHVTNEYWERDLSFNLDPLEKALLLLSGRS